MLIIVGGYNKSGKSYYAERLAASLASGALVYVATFVPVGDGVEGQATIAHHRAQRRGLGFDTIECPTDVGMLQLPKNATTLLEDVSNLLGNNIFSRQNKKTEAIVQDILSLNTKCTNLVVVTIDGLTQETEYDEETNEYIRLLDAVNAQLYAEADAVILMDKGQPVVKKGEVGGFTV